jgi:GntR family transcriptional repressor for pyruvate dehydrogenase complex
MTEMFAPLRTETASKQICNAIQKKILHRTLNAGDTLPTESELARQFGVNRSTVREALRTLESCGLVKRPVSSKRMLVTRPEVRTVAANVSRALQLHDVTFLQVWDAMMLIEPEVAARAARCRRSAHVSALEGIAETMAEGASTADVAVELTDKFFRVLHTACGNPVLEMASEPLTYLLRPTLQRMIHKVPQSQQRIAQAQLRLSKAIRGRDTAAAGEWMRKHIRDFRRGYEIAGISLNARVDFSEAG